MKAAFITGVTGQDGSYLAEFLLTMNYSVYGMTRHASEAQYERINHLKSNPEFNLVEGDVMDGARLSTIINSIGKLYETVEIYNLAAQTGAVTSFEQPELTFNINSLGPLRILEIIRNSNYKSKFKFFQASSSEMFGNCGEVLKNEDAPFCPSGPIGVSKVSSYWTTRNYRETWGIFACTGTMFNHESERRGPQFLSRKVTLGICEWIKTKKPIELGNLDAKRDWGHAIDYVYAMWLMLQQEKPDDYVIGTGQLHSVREFVETVLRTLKISFRWVGSDEDEMCLELWSGAPIIKVNRELLRQTETSAKCADARKAYDVLNWRPTISFDELVQRMLKNDVQNNI